MNPDLIAMFEKVVTAMKTDPRCKGGWHYGSAGRGETDEWSDYDLVFLVGSDDYEAFTADIPKVLTDSSDELLIHWPENYNNDCFRTFCSIVRLGENLHQFDSFILNADRPDDWMCRIHCKGCDESNIIFDRAGETAAFLKMGYTTENYIPDTMRAIDTYWFHVQMLVKYFKRGDIFKLIKNIYEFLFRTHVDLLLSRYDTLDWGGWEPKIKRCVPEEMQRHCLAYFAPADFASLQAAVEKGIDLFEQDAKAICAFKGIDYPQNISDQVMAYFRRMLS
ncbi:MAG: aminoglycoside 6-adenylyltransferase [Oscillospiraceae bacterium]|nr:aminoglycoside 6-adenylyltransferase [Oscillospiraceae bacterium]